MRFGSDLWNEEGRAVFDELPDKFNITRVEASVKIIIAKLITTKAFLRRIKYQYSLVFRGCKGND